MWKYLFYAFLIYLLYRFVFHFIIPVYKTTKHVKKQFREMNTRMEDFVNQQRTNQQTTAPQPNTNKEKPGDYIDFEEVK